MACEHGCHELPVAEVAGDEEQAAPLGRGSSVAEIVAAVRFILASPSMTGSVISIDGGESLTRRPRDVAFDKS
jgi:hypothetical protein